MKKSILLIALISLTLNTIFAHQRMRISKGKHSLSKPIRANCVDRDLAAPLGDVFNLSTNSIFLIGNTVNEISLQKAIADGIVEIRGNGARSIDIEILKPELGYEYLDVRNSFGVIGSDKIETHVDVNNLNKDAVKLRVDDLNKLKDLEGEMNVIDEKCEELALKYSENHPVREFMNSGRFKIDGLFNKDDYSVQDIRLKINELTKNVQLYEKNYKWYSNHKKLKDYREHLTTKYDVDNVVFRDFKKIESEIENSLKSNVQENIKKDIDDLIEGTRKKEEVIDLLNPDDYVFLDRYIWDYGILKNKNIVIENPDDLSTEHIRHILKFNKKNPFVFSKQALFANFNLPKEKLKFIVIGSENVDKNIELYRQNNMHAFTKRINTFRNSKELSQYFEFVSSKEALEESLERNKDYRTITLYHNEGDMLFGELKSSYAMQDRLTCNSFEEGFWENSIESTNRIDLEDVINSFANLIRNNPEKNEFQILDFYKRFSEEYSNIRRAREMKNDLIKKGGTVVVIVTGTGVMILWVPTGNISGKVKSESSIELDSIQVNLFDTKGNKISSTNTANGKFLFEDIMSSEYYLQIEDDVEVLEAKDDTPEDSRDKEAIYGGYIYVNLEPKELDQDNNFKINKSKTR